MLPMITPERTETTIINNAHTFNAPNSYMIYIDSLWDFRRIFSDRSIWIIYAIEI